MSKQLVYQIHSELLNYKPSMWRKFKVRANIKLTELAFVLLHLYEMEGYHLFSFDVPQKKVAKNPFSRGQKNIRYEIPCEESADFGMPSEDATKCTVASAIKDERKKFYFEYDFGDCWQLCLRLEKILDEENKNLPVVIAGEGYGIIEDCGGIYGLMDIDDALKLKQGEKYEEIIEWRGKKYFDTYLSGFDVEKSNKNMKKSIKQFAEFYEVKI